MLLLHCTRAKLAPRAAASIDLRFDYGYSKEEKAAVPILLAAAAAATSWTTTK